jgi:hypothetical protein
MAAFAAVCEEPPMSDLAPLARLDAIAQAELCARGEVIEQELFEVRICTRKSAAVSQKNFITARCEGVATAASSGSVAGAWACTSSSPRRRTACHVAIAPSPASSIRMLTPVHTTVSPDGRLPTSGSCGQLFVYETVSSGRWATAAHALQKKNAESWRAFAGSSSVPCGIAYSSRPDAKTPA